MAVPPLILASASPARRQLLTQAGIPHEVQRSDFNEDLIHHDDPQRLVTELALAKAQVVAQTRRQSLILGCDSLLWFQGQLQGKPASVAEAIARWQTMRGKTGYLYTGHALIDQTQQKHLVRWGVTEVDFAAVSDRTITSYIDQSNAMNCAGCFELEGKGGLLIEQIRGCHSNVIGLSLPLLRQMLTDLNYEISDFWVGSKNLA